MNYITEQISSDLLAKLSKSVNIWSDQIRPEAVRVKDEEKKGMRSMAEGREGYVRLVAKVATQHEKYLSRADTAADLNDRLRYYDVLATARQSLMELFELIDGTQWGAGVDCMRYADRFNNTLQNHRDDSAIDAALNEIDEWNKRYSRNNNSDNAATQSESTPQ